MFDDEFDVHSSSEECVIKQTEKQKKKIQKNWKEWTSVVRSFRSFFLIYSLRKQK